MEELKDPKGTLITGTAILSYTVCKRQAWLTLHRFLPEQENEYLTIGNFIHQNTFKNQGQKEIALPGAKLDMIWKNRSITVVGEIKKSSRSIKGGRVQLLYYLSLLEAKGLKSKGEIIIPQEHRRLPVELNKETKQELQEVKEALIKLGKEEIPPKPKRKGICSKCGYFNFCRA